MLFMYSFKCIYDVVWHQKVSDAVDEEELLEDFYADDDETNILYNEAGELKAASYTRLIAHLSEPSNLVGMYTRPMLM